MIKKVTELRDFDDNEFIVYTQDNTLLKGLRSEATKFVWYEQWKNCSPQDPILAGVDMYFPNSKRTMVISKLKG